MSAEQVVEASLEALERQQALCIPGAGNRVLAAFQSVAPRGIKRRIMGAALRRALR
jgi:short-subunit dehydrogenase